MKAEKTRDLLKYNCSMCQRAFEIMDKGICAPSCISDFRISEEIDLELSELERKAKVYDDVMAIANHKDYLLTIVVADFVNNSEVTFFNERGIEMYVDVRRLRESEEVE